MIFARVDLATLFLGAGFQAWICAALLLFVRPQARSRRLPMLLLAIGLMLAGISLGCVGLRGSIPAWATFGLTSFAGASGTLFVWQALRTQLGRRLQTRLMVVLHILWLGVTWWLGIDPADVPTRTIAVSIAVALCSFATAWEALNVPPGMPRRPLRLAVAVSTSVAVVSLVRAGVAMFSVVPTTATGVLIANPAQTFFVLFYLAAPLLMTMVMLAIVNEKLNHDLRMMADTDVLTQLWSRRYLFERGPALMAEAALAGRSSLLLMMDLDHFKGINDQYGHAVGDQVLRQCAQAIRSALPPEALVARYGGEEICAILAVTDVRSAATVAEQVRATVAARAILLADRELRITLSIGVAAHRDRRTLEQVLVAADRGVYQAKAAGRNRVMLEPLINPQPSLGAPVV